MQLNREQFWRLLEPMHPQAESFCRKLAGNRLDGDDLYQEAVLCALTHSDSLRKEEAFKPWLYRIILNRFRNRARREWWRRHLRLSDLRPDEEPSRDPTSGLDSKRYLELAMAHLKTKERALVTLFELEGWSLREVASLLDEPEGTIKARLSRARARMRKALMSHLPRKSEQKRTEERYELPESTASSERNPPLGDGCH